MLPRSKGFSDYGFLLQFLQNLGCHRPIPDLSTQAFVRFRTYLYQLQAWMLDSRDSINHSNSSFWKKYKEEKVTVAVSHRDAPLDGTVL